MFLKILFSIFILNQALAQDTPTINVTGDLMSFKSGIEQLKSGKLDESEQSLTKYLLSNGRLQEHAYFYLGQVYLQKNQYEKARDSFGHVLNFKPNLKLWLETHLNLAKIELQFNEYRKAKNYLVNIERRGRGTDIHSDIIYYLSLVEQKTNNHKRSCIWLNKLYSTRPNYEKIKDWGPILSENMFEGEPTKCENKVDDFKRRLKFLLLSGNEGKARSEVEIVSNKAQSENPSLANELRAQFFLQDGEPQKAFDILKNNYEQQKNNEKYLNLLAQSAARGGDESMAIGLYDRIYQINGKGKKGLEALYQSAFMSYQSLDYDGASRKFKKFIQLTKKQSLKAEAQWHLAWLQYLKGHFDSAEKSLATLLKSSRKKSEKLEYWFAMSLYRQGKKEAARGVFEKLNKDALRSYYGIASGYRLKKINSELLEQQKEKILINKKLASTSADNKSGAEANLQNDERGVGFFELFSSNNSGNVDNDKEESVTQSLAQIDNDEEDSIEADSDKTQETGSSDIMPGDLESDKITSFQDPNLMKRFEKAQDLTIIGFTDLAKWDLFEIERKTSNKEYLRVLMTEYSQTGNYNRSSTIAFLNFNDQMKKYGIGGIKYLWEMAYPKAYLASVESYSEKFEVPKELIWGIMRAESKYKLDAVSPVGALGLMQIMPFTGRRVSLLIGEKNFNPESLLTGEGAIKYGSRYLKRLMTKFENVYPLVSAAYNAGPHRVQNWISTFGYLDTDEFIEHIPFIETRGYVKKVLSNCEIYNQLYGDKKELFPYLGQSIPYQYTTDIKLTKEIWDEI